MKNKPILSRLILSISLAYLMLMSLFLMGDLNIIISQFTLTPVLFSLAINFSLKTSLPRHVLFFILSNCVYWFSFFIVSIDRYGLPKTEFVILGTGIGAFLEIILFALVFKLIKQLKIKHLLLGLIIGALSFSLSNYFRNFGLTLFGYAFWYFGVALVMFDIYKMKKQ